MEEKRPKAVMNSRATTGGELPREILHEPHFTIQYQNHFFCRLPINFIYGLVIRTCNIMVLESMVSLKPHLHGPYISLGHTLFASKSPPAAPQIFQKSLIKVHASNHIGITFTQGLKGSSFLGTMVLPKKKIGHNQKGTRLETLGMI